MDFSKYYDGSITTFISVIIGYGFVLFIKTIKKINDSEDTKAKLDKHIIDTKEDFKEVNEDIRELRKKYLN